jgi:hypothetical protein
MVESKGGGGGSNKLTKRPLDTRRCRDNVRLSGGTRLCSGLTDDNAG